MSYLVYLKLPDLLYYIILTTTKYCEKNEIYEKKKFFSEFSKQHDYFDTRRKEKEKKEKVQTKIENQKHRNINQLHMFEFV